LEVPVSSTLVEIPAQTAIALILRSGEVLRIVDGFGAQVADLALFNQDDPSEAFSPGRTIDYNESLTLGLGDVLYSNRSGELARIVEDTVGVHDMLLAPCSELMFARRGEFSHPSCHANLASVLHPFGVLDDMVTSTLNVFMDVRITGQNRIEVHPPASKLGDRFAIRALRDLVIGIAACSSERTNAGHCRPIYYQVLPRSVAGSAVVATPGGDESL
jgi:uncharacterized protein YcgI (DUF1989 family)